MRKCITSISVGFAIMLFISCTKDDVVSEGSELAVLSFGTVLNDLVSGNDNLKQQLEGAPSCSGEEPAFVEVVLSGPTDVGTIQEPLVVQVNPTPGNYDGDPESEYFTQESEDLKLQPGDYTLQYFAVYDGHPDAPEANRIWIAPMEGGTFANLVVNPLPLDISLGAGVKKYVDVEVLCFDDRVVNEYGYLFFDIDGTEAIEFCVFGNYCDENGRHFSASFSLDVWMFSGDPENPKGQLINTNLTNTTSINSSGDAFAEPVCFALPDREGEDEYYLEITLLGGEGYQVEPEVVRQGIFTDSDVRALLNEDETLEYYHFRAGACSEGDNPDLFSTSSTPPVAEGQEPVSGYVELPRSVDPTTITIVSSSGSFEVQEDGSFDGAKTKTSKQFLFAENQEGEILLATLTDSKQEVLNFSTTAEAMVALLPWTAFVEKSDLQSVLNEVAQLNGYEEFEEAIETAVENGISPSMDDNVLLHLQALNKQITMSEGMNSKVMTYKIPEVFHTVEPKIEHSNGGFIIRNDGTTTSAWGVEVFDKEGKSLTGNLVLPGNKVMFPSISSISDFINGDFMKAVFQKAEPLEIPLSVEGKYKVVFESENFITSDLAREAAYYNVANMYRTLFTAFGINYDDFGCMNNLFDASVNVILDTMSNEEITHTFVLDQFYQFFNGYIISYDKCGGIETPKYTKSLAKFVNGYAKLEAVFVLGKLLGDWDVLKDVEVMRLIANHEMYPSFHLKKYVLPEDQEVAPGEWISLSVATDLDLPGQSVQLFPIGAEISWEVLEGDGSLEADKSYVEDGGMTHMTYVVGKENKQVIKAAVKDKNGEDIEAVEFDLNIGESSLCLQEGSGIYYNWDSTTSISSPNGFQQDLSGEIDGDNVTFSYWYSAGLAKYLVKYDLKRKGAELVGTRTECRTFGGSSCSRTPTETNATLKIIPCD